MNRKELDKLIALSRRRPVAEAMLLWPMAWVFFVVVFAATFPEFLHVGETFLLERAALAILIGGTIAGALCFGFAARKVKRVAAAKAKLRGLAADLKDK